MNALKRFFSRATASLVLLTLYASGDTPNPGNGGANTQDFPKILLRGYGTVGGTFTTTTADGQIGSVLAIDCENGDKAKLLQAKFLSDEQTLPGVTKTDFKTGQWGVGGLQFGGTQVSAYEARNQGFFAALRLDSKVLIIASPTREGLVATADNALKSNTAPVISDPEVEVPMWLDRWDKHGFRFYYAPWMTAPGHQNETYDFRGDFAFAKDAGVGMVFWDNFNKVMGTDGQTDQTFWNHNVELARQNNLPLAINLSTLNYDIPNWMANRYRTGMQQPMPDYLGDSMSVAGWRGTSGKVGEVAWGATEARDAMLGAMQADVRRFVNVPNVVSWMEPHNELSQGGDDFMGYGPACDITYRDYLRSHYGSVDKVSQAWFGQPDTLKSWDDIRVPELASFIGWSPDALDLAGTWQANFTDGKQPPTPEWLTPTFDDSKWQPVIAPSDDRNFQLPKTPAVYRRSFDLPADWLAKHPKVWIYLWDLNISRDDKQWPIAIYLNGQKAGESPCRPGGISHWMATEATTFLKSGSNQITLALPSGYLGYRIYLSGTEPKQYPNLGEGLNTQWVDFIGWRQSTRTDSVRRGMEMIREIDPNRPITLASPWYSIDGLKGLAQQYGGEFHDTGFMSGIWDDLLPSLMRGSALPTSLEPGGPAATVNEFKWMASRWETEGLQQTDYFLHIGDVEWNPAIRQQFEEDLPMLHLIGKYHLPQADVAFLFSSRNDALTGYPWSNDLNTNLPGGRTCWGMANDMLKLCPRDAITEGDFARGNAAHYKVIIDTNTSIMDQPMIDQIEKYVSDGGIFVTFGNTGRHSPTKPDSWPISQLTGYQVLTVERFDPKGLSIRYNSDPHPAGSPWQSFHPAPGQELFTKVDPWMTTPWVTGLRMKKIDADSQDLLVWNDGAIAAGMRKIGKGAIVEMGCKANNQPWLGVDLSAFMPFFQQAGVKMNRTEVSFDKPLELLKDYFFRDYDSNNGLYDVSVVSNETEAPVKATITFKETQPATALDVTSGQEIPVRNGKLADIAFDARQMKIFLTPRNRITRAPADWFELQRKWWKAAPPVTKPLPKETSKFVLDLDENWSWHPMADKEDPTPYLAANFDDAKWTRLGLGAWNAAPERRDVKDALMRHTFIIPTEWNNGTVGLWLQTGGFPTFADTGTFWLDGKQLQPFFRESSIAGLEVGGASGSTHTLVVEAKGPGQFIGLIGDAWLDYVPKPVGTVDLAGVWTTCKDDIFHDTGTVTWPGAYAAHSLWRTINVPKEDEGGTVMLTMQADRPFQTYINGSLVQYSGTPTQNSHVGLNVTPWIRFGQDNRIQLVSRYDRGSMARVALDFYDVGTYP
jgi:hypothetical protein